MADAEQAFKAYWASTVHPFIKDDFERLLSTTPSRIAEKEKSEKEKPKKGEKAEKEKAKKDRVHEKLTGILAEVKEHGERRNAYLNLAWTGPVDNSFLQEKPSTVAVWDFQPALVRENQLFRRGGHLSDTFQPTHAIEIVPPA